MKVDAAHIRDAVRALVDAKETNLGIEVMLPVAYPDGDMVTVIVEKSGGGFVVHDSSFGAMRVTATGLRLSQSFVAKSKELAARYNCSFINGRVSLLTTTHGLPMAIALVANASRAIADQATETRRHTDVEFRNEVADRLKAVVGPRVRENEEVRGKSGRLYRVPAIVLDVAQSKPEHFVATVTSRASVLNHFAEFYDLSDAYSDVRNDAVYDEYADIRKEDLLLLGRVCELIAFNQTKIRFAGMFDNAQKATP